MFTFTNPRETSLWSKAEKQQPTQDFRTMPFLASNGDSIGQEGTSALWEWVFHYWLSCVYKWLSLPWLAILVMVYSCGGKRNRSHSPHHRWSLAWTSNGPGDFRLHFEIRIARCGISLPWFIYSRASPSDVRWRGSCILRCPLHKATVD